MKKHLFLLCMLVSGLLFYGQGIKAQTQLLDVNKFMATQGWYTTTSTVSGTVYTFDVTFDDASTHTFTLRTNGSNQLTAGTSLLIKGNTSGYNSFYLQFPVFNTDYTVTLTSTSTSPIVTLAISYDNGSSWDANFDPVIAGAGTATSKTIPSGALVRLWSNHASSAMTITRMIFNSVPTDNTPPALAETNPLDGATGVSPTITALSVTFDKDIQTGTGDITITDGVTPKTVLLSACTASGATLTIPVSGLSAGTTYTVTVPAGAIGNVSGTATTSATIFSFTTSASLSSAAEIIGVDFGPRQIGDASINSSAGTVDVTVQYSTAITPIANFASITLPVKVTDSDITGITLSENAIIPAALPTSYATPPTINVRAEDGITTKPWTINVQTAPLLPKLLPIGLECMTPTNNGPSPIDPSLDIYLNVQAPGYASNHVTATSRNRVSGWIENSANLPWRDSYPMAFSRPGHYLITHWTEAEEAAKIVSFRARSGDATYGFVVEESDDANTWTNVGTLTNTGTGSELVAVGNYPLTLRSYLIKNNTSRYLRFYYTVRGASSFYVDDIKIENADCETDVALVEPLSIGYTSTRIELQFTKAIKLASNTQGIKVNGYNLGNGTTDIGDEEYNLYFYRDGKVHLNTNQVKVGENTIFIPAGDIKNLKDVCSSTPNPIPAKGLRSTSEDGLTITFTIPDDGSISAPVAGTVKYVTATTEGTMTPTSIGKVTVDGVLVKKQYFTLQGIEIPSATAAGIYIIKNIYDNGSVKVEKVIVR
ncbi:MAG: Ig-like domain-containing protein [Candidatus Azobacteroides sp.]|nr:Ig-like domain-containing protein [Candidatus Azobacteroides sp.]